MRPHHLIAAAILASVVFSAHPALAFSMDEKTSTNPDGTARYADPDEAQPSTLFLFGAQGQTRTDDSNRDPNARFTAPASGGASQSLQLPDWFFFSPSRRK
jgi:hypothetical protein